MSKTLLERISEDRRVLGNPYAFLDGEGRFSVVPNLIPVRKTSYSDTEVQQSARLLQILMWKNRTQLGFSPVATPLEVLRPDIALSLLGFQVEIEETLGRFRDDGNREIEVAGVFDSDNQVVRVSRQFQSDVRTFTLAHELGHAVYGHQTGVHRDRPLTGAMVSRDPIEATADRFATFFLMPDKLVRKEFEQTFLAHALVVNEAMVYALARCDVQTFMKRFPNQRAVARLVASTERFNGVQIIPLAKRFGVSLEAMAIRLEELALVRI